MVNLRAWLGGRLARYLTRATRVTGSAPATPQNLLVSTLQPGDVLLVEGHSRISTAIKYLTQSTWSHATLYVGDAVVKRGGPTGHCFVEADTVQGVRSVGLDHYAGFHTRICRPWNLTQAEVEQVVGFAIDRIGNPYDLRNVWDLARYLWPTPPVPAHLRHHLLYLGSGDPTRAICSTLIAQAFQSINYPILPSLRYQQAAREQASPSALLPTPTTFDGSRHQHPSLFTPRDFDVSPYFQVVKPTLVTGFDFRLMQWQRPQAQMHYSEISDS